jgi:hypothetical protein
MSADSDGGLLFLRWNRVDWDNNSLRTPASHGWLTAVHREITMSTCFSVAQMLRSRSQLPFFLMNLRVLSQSRKSTTLVYPNNSW